MSKIPRHEQGQARTYEALVALACRYGRPDDDADRWARAVLRGREIGALARRGAMTKVGRRLLARELRER